MKVKKNLRRAKNPPSQESSEFPIVPVMAIFLVFAGLGVFVYWDRKRRTINPNRPQLTSNFTAQQYRSQLQMPAFQASNLDPDGVPTWMNRDTTNPQIDRWLNDPSYWNSESSGGSGSSGQQTNQTQTNQTQTNQTNSGGFYVYYYVASDLPIGPVIKQVLESRISSLPGFDSELTRRSSSVDISRFIEQASQTNSANQIRNILNNPNKKLAIVYLLREGIKISIFDPSGSEIYDNLNYWQDGTRPTSEEANAAFDLARNSI